MHFPARRVQSRSGVRIVAKAIRQVARPAGRLDREAAGQKGWGLLGDVGKAVTPGAATTVAATTQAAPAKQAAARTRRTPMREAHDQVARSLRQAYQQTVDEAVPDSMLDLIKRLS